ncbi:GNAT family N-acetyltransferase [Corynebacterium ulceribovis]|uniref:GNAT family N-acetyltransferase n=1 Tax=Corynebacterium ulceribovis TaxID=487732 RepID=UPI00037F8AA8
MYLSAPPVGQGKHSAMHPGWPYSTEQVATRRGTVGLRPLRWADGDAWRRLRVSDEELLRPYEPTVAGEWAQAHDRQGWRSSFQQLRHLALTGAAVPMVIEVDGHFAGQLTLGNIAHRPVSSCWIGYWVHSNFTGGGVATAAVALGVDHAFGPVGLHRVEATVRPDNAASRAVLSANGFRQEGLLRANLHIDGRWEDHLLVAQVAGEHRRSAVARLAAAGKLELL